MINLTHAVIFSNGEQDLKMRVEKSGNACILFLYKDMMEGELYKKYNCRKSSSSRYHYFTGNVLYDLLSLLPKEFIGGRYNEFKVKELTFHTDYYTGATIIDQIKTDTVTYTGEEYRGIIKYPPIYTIHAKPDFYAEPKCAEQKPTETIGEWVESLDESHKNALYFLMGQAMETSKNKNDLKPKQVIFSPPATIVFWGDNTKTIVKCSPEEVYDREKGFAMAVCKKIFGENYKKTFRWVVQYAQWRPFGHVGIPRLGGTDKNGNLLRGIYTDEDGVDAI